ncbi:TetR/AcrR family transcriptional regulator [Shewanella alkalitolerans]|uniref:TetR/AcrR family transcriptional regulator n=1 Tax=Shewanella alkalitolerans TaxID=2864209 RepID=UPI001C66184A|nr:TetR/AcrR family transcriptional regulator [Shewanella alkalitolerans]QYJ96638.1 TetR/AcrR family transcriptional regulator [Shewanella alkalitolerans]
MARSCNFDRQEKLVEAMELFWQKGYADTSVADLVDHLKINRFSLYNCFGDKLSLYREALAYYFDNHAMPNLTPLFVETAGLDELVTYLEEFIVRQSNQPFGCFLQNAVLEKYLSDEVVQGICTRLFDELHQTFERVLQGAQQRGELLAGVQCTQLASFLVMQMQGIRVLGKARQQARIAQAREVLMGYLKSLAVSG